MSSLFSDDAYDREYAALPWVDGRPVRDRWPAPPVGIPDRTRLAPDIWHLAAHPSALAMTGSVIERLDPFLTSVAELLPLGFDRPDGEELFALNVLTRLPVESVFDTAAGADERWRELESYADVLSAEEHEAVLEDARKGDPWPVLYPAFIEDQLPEMPTFFTVDRFGPGLFLVDRDDAPDSLMRRVAEFEMTGLVMQKLWSNVTGPEPINLFRP